MWWVGKALTINRPAERIHGRFAPPPGVVSELRARWNRSCDRKRKVSVMYGQTVSGFGKYNTYLINRESLKAGTTAGGRTAACL